MHRLEESCDEKHCHQCAVTSLSSRIRVDDCTMMKFCQLIKSQIDRRERCHSPSVYAEDSDLALMMAFSALWASGILRDVIPRPLGGCYFPQ